MGKGSSRNDACPCGSGVKYKRCCLAEHQRAAVARSKPLAWDADPDTPRNTALDRIDAGDLDGAQALADRLFTDFPDHPDGHELYARILEARGQPHDAAAHLRKLIALLDHLDDRPNFEPSFFTRLDNEIVRLMALTPGAASDGPEPRGA